MSTDEPGLAPVEQHELVDWLIARGVKVNGSYTEPSESPDY